MPRHRVELFTNRARELCDEAGIPPFDDTHYDVLRDALYFLWHEPPFTIGADLARSSINGVTPEMLREAYATKLAAADSPPR